MGGVCPYLQGIVGLSTQNAIELSRFLDHVQVSSQPVDDGLLHSTLYNFYVGKYFRFMFKSVRKPCSNLIDAVKMCKASQHDFGNLLVTSKMKPISSNYDNLITILQKLCQKRSGKEPEESDHSDAKHPSCTPNSSSNSLYYDTSNSNTPLVQLYSIDDSGQSSSCSIINPTSNAIEAGHTAEHNLSSLPSQEQRDIIEQLSDSTDDETKQCETLQSTDQVSESIKNEVVAELKTEWEELQTQNLSNTSSILSSFWAQLPTQQQYLSFLSFEDKITESDDGETHHGVDVHSSTPLASHGDIFSPELFQSSSLPHHNMINNSPVHNNLLLERASKRHRKDELHHTPTGPKTFSRIELKYASTPRSSSSKKLLIPCKTPISGGDNVANVHEKFSPDLFS